MPNDTLDQEPIIDQVPEDEVIEGPEFEEKALALTSRASELYSLEPRSLKEVQSLAIVFAQSGMFEDVREMSQAFVKIMWGRKLGFGAVESMTGIHMIHNKPAVGAHLIAAGIRSNPRYDYDVVVHTDEICTIRLFKDGKLFKEESFTIQDAHQADLTTGKNAHTWKKYPRNMLFARCISNIQKFHCPDVFAMPVYTPEEMGMEVDEYGSPIIEGEFEVKTETRQLPETTEKPKSKPRQQQESSSKPPAKSKSEEMNIPWQEHISTFTGKEWSAYWLNMKELKISNDEVHAALGVTSVKDFTGTRLEHNQAISSIIKSRESGEKQSKPENPAQPETTQGDDFVVPDQDQDDDSKPAVSMDGEDGWITVSRIHLLQTDEMTTPHMKVWAWDEMSEAEDPLEVMAHDMIAEEIEAFGSHMPKKIGKKLGSTIYTFDPDKENWLVAEWKRDKGKVPRIIAFEETA